MPAYNNLAKILAAEGKHAEATEVCRRGLIFSPDSAVLHCTLGTLLARQGQRTEAIKEFQTALRFDPNSAPARDSLRILLNGPN
ncbi:MAG: tetratricopeptide repeat protein [Sedimentisphaerales bacterium]|nr:tetratricopeptide repeat protein [Sedimentisphaerales bacterium]HNY78720.1 tetratricopeptide repeat protein [Sedimentisphaerales bacterium]HOC63915.1 tetratricopeptide repeat protein [Sedimentisphaerales bacterium]HOH64667.1 tetratricopeptide repeat protein [Sedimentisphaerales bacterium]HPY52119.1 tetratricopeptide repeat protein [Sedimentisphaerales bacterium]